MVKNYFSGDRVPAMKKITLLLALLMSFNLFADCRPQIEEALVNRITSQRKVSRIGMVSTGAAFVTIGGFYGYMGVVMVGPLWAGAVIGGTFGGLAALPVGTTFLIANKVMKNRVRKLGRMISILDGGDELKILHSQLATKYPHLTIEQLAHEVALLDQSEALCDGSIARFGRFAGPKDLRRYFNRQWRTIALVH